MNFEKCKREKWLSQIESSREKNDIDPLNIRINFVLDALEIPQTPFSSSSEIEKYVNNIRPVILGIRKGAELGSYDFRDSYPTGLPVQLKEVIEREALEIITSQYEHLKKVKKNYYEKGDPFCLDTPIYWIYLFDIPVFLKGSYHDLRSFKWHRSSFIDINKHAKIISIEGGVNKPFKECLDWIWNDPTGEKSFYTRLMRDAVILGKFNGIFAQVDPRGSSIIRIKHDLPFLYPERFLKVYFNYLAKENPIFLNYLKSLKELKKFLSQSSVWAKILKCEGIYYNGKSHVFIPYPASFIKEKVPSSFSSPSLPFPLFFFASLFHLTGESTFKPTSLEMGRTLFSDALSAIRLYLITKLMKDGYLEKGPIINYIGGGHLSFLYYFLKNPEEAMKVIFRSRYHLYEDEAKNFNELCEILQKPNWPRDIEKLTTIEFRKVEEGKVKRVPINFLDIYNINPEKVIPSDKEIKEISKEKVSQL